MFLSKGHLKRFRRLLARIAQGVRNQVGNCSRTLSPHTDTKDDGDDDYDKNDDDDDGDESVLMMMMMTMMMMMMMMMMILLSQPPTNDCFFSTVPPHHRTIPLGIPCHTLPYHTIPLYPTYYGISYRVNHSHAIGPYAHLTPYHTKAVPFDFFCKVWLDSTTHLWSR